MPQQKLKIRPATKPSTASTQPDRPIDEFAEDSEEVDSEPEGEAVVTGTLDDLADDDEDMADIDDDFSDDEAASEEDEEDGMQGVERPLKSTLNFYWNLSSSLKKYLM